MSGLDGGVLRCDQRFRAKSPLKSCINSYVVLRVVNCGLEQPYNHKLLIANYELSLFIFWREQFLAGNGSFPAKKHERFTINNSQLTILPKSRTL